jgi:hypothetical protein
LKPSFANALSPANTPQEGLCLRHLCRTGASAGDIDIHYDGRNTLNATRRRLGGLLGFGITHAAREFDYTVMYFDANRVANDIALVTQLCKDVLLNLHIIFHHAVPFKGKR